MSPNENHDSGAGAETLDQISSGLSVAVVSISGNDAISRRLDDLGLRAGVEIEVIRRAPLGDPTLFELCGYQLCLRRSEAGRVRVKPLSSDSATDPRESGSARS